MLQLSKCDLCKITVKRGDKVKLAIIQCEVEKETQNIKNIFRDEQGIIEVTLLQNRIDTDVVCLPTHYYCNLGCKMCHLEESKKCDKPIMYENILEAITRTITQYGKRVTDKKKLLLSFMGVGEPTLNFELISALYDNETYLKEKFGYEHIGYAMATILPNDGFKGIINKVNEKNIPLKVHFSLHAANTKKRKDLIPNSKNSVKECMNMLKEYETVTKTNKKIQTEFIQCHQSTDMVEIHYSLIENFNDNNNDFIELTNLLNEYHFTIKLIRLNPTETMKISQRMDAWSNMLRRFSSVRIKQDSNSHLVQSYYGEFSSLYNETAT